MARTSAKAPSIGLTGVKFEAQSDALFDALYDYLIRAYEFDGNDILIETVEKADLRKAMGASRTVSGALWAVREKLGSVEQAEYRSEIQATAW